jgi:hypothetical protein
MELRKKEWTKATRKNGHPIPKLWIRASGCYYAQIAIHDPAKERNVTKKMGHQRIIWIRLIAGTANLFLPLPLPGSI